MKALKITGVVLLVVVVVIAGLVFYGLSNLDQLVRTAVERFGSETTQTEVALQDVDIDLRAGRAQLGNLSVANPEGYTRKNAFTLDDIVVHIVPASVGTSSEDVVVVEEISVRGASIIAELQGLTRSNLQELAENVRDDTSEADQPETEPGPASEYTGPNFRVRRFEFTDASVALISDQFGERTLEMPPVTASDLGGEDGLPPDELAAALMDHVLTAAMDTVQEEAEGSAKRKVEDKLRENLSEEEQEQLQELQNLFNR